MYIIKEEEDEEEAEAEKKPSIYVDYKGKHCSLEPCFFFFYSLDFLYFDRSISFFIWNFTW